MTESTPPKRRRLREPGPAPLAPGLYMVGRFGDIHDVTGQNWMVEMADADLAALAAYLEVTHAHVNRVTATREQAYRAQFSWDHPPVVERQPDLRDVEPESPNSLALKAARAEAMSEPSPAVMAKVDAALADPQAFANRARPEPVVIEETLGTKPATVRPPMPWDEDTKDDPWANTPA